MKKILIALLLSIHAEAYHDFDFEQIKKDAERLEAVVFKMDFNIENPNSIKAMNNKKWVKYIRPLL